MWHITSFLNCFSLGKMGVGSQGGGGGGEKLKRGFKSGSKGNVIYSLHKNCYTCGAQTQTLGKT